MLDMPRAKIVAQLMHTGRLAHVADYQLAPRSSARLRLRALARCTPRGTACSLTACRAFNS